MNPRCFYYVFVSGVNQVEREKEVSRRFPLVTPGVFESFHSALPQARWLNIVCVEYLQLIKSKVVGFCFIGV